MHAEVFDWVAKWAPAEPVTVLDVGGRDINGTPTSAFHPESTFEVVDLHPSPNVMWVGDFLAYGERTGFDVVCHLEVAEHCAEWIAHLRHARDLLDVDGFLIFTAAGPGRVPHSALDGGAVRAGEWYRNVDPDALDWALCQLFARHVMDVTGPDVRAVAWK